MDATEIRMRCIEVAQAASRSGPVPTQPEIIIGWASKFEAFVNGETPKPAARTKKEAAT